ncbi:MFS transporter [Streptomyces sp. NPDC005386]|uniref:MFS transporter n=1 Tax=Streptomyces sp. NPDC005386 TaxID=3154562 RepID=UPI00339F4973
MMLSRLAKPWRRPDDVPALGRAGRFFILGNSISAFGASLAMPYFAIFLIGIRGGAASAVGVLTLISVVDLVAQRLVASPLERSYGGRLPAIAGCWIQAVGWASLALSTAPWQVFACACAIGLGNALFFSVRVNLQMDIVDEAAHGYSFALRYLCGNIGILLGGVLGGATVSWLGTDDGVTVLLLANSATFILFALIITSAVTPSAEQRHSKRHALNDGESKPRDRRWNSAATGLLVGYFLLVTAGLVQFETVLPLQLTAHGGIPAWGIGYLFSASALTTVVLQMPIARLAARFGGITSVRIIATTWVLAALMLWSSAHLSSPGKITLIVIGALLFASGECLFFPSIPDLLKTNDPELRRRAGSLTASAHSLGQFVGPSLGIVLVTHSAVGFYLLVAGGACIAAVVTRQLRTGSRDEALTARSKAASQS